VTDFNIDIEFKLARGDIPGSFWESYSAIVQILWNCRTEKFAKHRQIAELLYFC
jgi:hypothetical protein